MDRHDIAGLHIICSSFINPERITYVLYPVDMLGQWIDGAAQKYDTTIAVVTGMQWDDDLTPWPAKGQPKGAKPFKGLAADFLEKLQRQVIPDTETRLGINDHADRDLVGVSLSGLFTLWQWIVCDLFRSIACLSGSFWYEGFTTWLNIRDIPSKSGRAYFSLGDKESRTRVKAFKSVAADTQTVISKLRSSGIDAVFESVPGNHYDGMLSRLDKAFYYLYLKKE